MHYKYKSKPFAHQKKALEMSWDKEVFAYFMEMGTGKSKVLVDNIFSSSPSLCRPSMRGVGRASGNRPRSAALLQGNGVAARRGPVLVDWSWAPLLGPRKDGVSSNGSVAAAASLKSSGGFPACS